MMRAGDRIVVSGLGEASDWFILVQILDVDEALLELQSRQRGASILTPAFFGAKHIVDRSR